VGEKKSELNLKIFFKYFSSVVDFFFSQLLKIWLLFSDFCFFHLSVLDINANFQKTKIKGKSSPLHVLNVFFLFYDLTNYERKKQKTYSKTILKGE
jgi:hypothetical protein